VSWELVSARPHLQNHGVGSQYRGMTPVADKPLNPDCVNARWSQSALSPNSSGRERPDLHSER